MYEKEAEELLLWLALMDWWCHSNMHYQPQSSPISDTSQPGWGVGCH